MWNTPTGMPPSPKPEERASDKICDAVRMYFAERAVTADREVQLFRKQVKDGAPGSEADIHVTIPRNGTESGNEYVLPIEVKLSGNPEAKSGLKDQLVDRYMAQVGAEAGVFVVMWMETADMRRTTKPQWASIEEATAEVKAQATAASASGRIRVGTVVVDCSLL